MAPIWIWFTPLRYKVHNCSSLSSLEESKPLLNHEDSQRRLFYIIIYLYFSPSHRLSLDPFTLLSTYMFPPVVNRVWPSCCVILYFQADGTTYWQRVLHAHFHIFTTASNDRWLTLGGGAASSQGIWVSQGFIPPRKCLHLFKSH